MNVRVGVVVPVRNEEKYIGKTLEHLFEQTMKPKIVVVVSDGSDRTPEIAKKFGCTVITLPDRGYSLIGMPGLAEVTNIGFSLLKDMNYIMVLGGDTILPKNYIETLVSRMEETPKMVITSGVIKGERMSKTHVTGSGRLIKRDFFESIGFKYPPIWGWESYPLFKAQMMKYQIHSFEDLVMLSQRELGVTPKKYYFWGKGMRALGYYWSYALGRCFLTLAS